MNTIEIFAPKFKTKEVLIAPYRVASGINRIVFTKTWQGVELYMDGERIKSYPIQSNGTIDVHAVPIADFDKTSNQGKLL